MGEKIITGMLCLFSVIFFGIARTIPPSKVKSSLGTAFWPELILAILFIASTLHLAKLLRQKKEVEEQLSKAAEQARKREEEETGERKDFPLFLFGIGISFIYIFSLRWIGFVVPTPLLMGIFMYITGYRKKVMLAVIPLVTTAVFLLLFIKVTYLPLPRGYGIFRSISFLIY